MSTRSLRRKYPVTLEQLSPVVDYNSSEPESPTPVNVFASLDLSDSGSERSPSPSPVVENIHAPQPRSKKKANRKRRQNNEVDKDWELLQNLEANRNIEPETQVTEPVQTVTKLARVVRCEPRFFDSERELRQTFGSEAIHHDDSEQQSSSRNRRQTAKKRTHVRKTVIAKAKDEWPQPPALSQLGLSMRMDQENQCFTFVASDEYLTMQQQLEACRLTFDPQSIATLLQFQPWHCDTLMAMSEIYRVHGEFAVSSDLVSRVIYVMECNFHSGFDFLSEKPFCTLDTCQAVNATFLQALRRHMQFMCRRNCPRTALEVCKLLLTVILPRKASGPNASRDVLRLEMVHHLIYYALRCNAAHFILDFASCFDLLRGSSVEKPEEISLSHSVLALPSWAYGVSQAKYRLESENELFLGNIYGTIDLSNVDVTSSQCLQHALLLHPEALEPLLTAAKPKELGNTRWTYILSHRLFVRGASRRQSSDIIRKLVDIFVKRFFLLWKEDQLIEWLYANAKCLVDKLDQETTWEQEFEVFLNAFNESEIARSVLNLELSEFTDEIAVIPEGFNPGANVPPQPAVIDGVNPFRGQNPVVAFLTSLLPWMNAANTDQQ